MKLRPYLLLVLVALLALFPACRLLADSTTPPTEQGSTPGTAPKKKHHHHHAGDSTSTTNTPKLDNKVPPGSDSTASH